MAEILDLGKPEVNSKKGTRSQQEKNKPVVSSDVVMQGNQEVVYLLHMIRWFLIAIFREYNVTLLTVFHGNRFSE